LKQSGLPAIGLSIVSGRASIIWQQEPSSRPNIVFFLADDLDYNIGNPKDSWRHLPPERRRALPPDRYAVSPEMGRGLDVREITVGDMPGGKRWKNPSRGDPTEIIEYQDN